jgi:SAM-dependent methyltransferase
MPVTRERCCICGNEKISLHRSGREHAVDLASFGSSRTNLSVGDILRCDACGFAFSRVRPEGKRLAELYRDLDADTYEAEASGRLKTAQRHLKILHQYAAPPGTLLDVGCASGRFLRLAADAGWESLGVEPSQVLCERAKRLIGGRAEIIQCTLQDASLPVSFFSVITMWDVLEHVPDPQGFLRYAASLLKKGGTILLNVPDFDSVQARVLKSWWPLLLPEHLNYFNRGSLRRLAGSLDLELLAFGRRPAVFSLKYIMYRLGQHGLPGFSVVGRLCSRSPVADCLVPVFMGEVYSVWRKTQ